MLNLETNTNRQKLRTKKIPHFPAFTRKPMEITLLSILRRVFCICNLSCRFRHLLCVVGCGSGGCIVAYCPREPAGRFLHDDAG